MKKKIIYLTAVLCFLFSSSVYLQTTIITDDPAYTTGESSAILDVKSSSKGLLLPRLTAEQREAIDNPVAGLLIWCTDCGSTGQVQVFNGINWMDMQGNAVFGSSICGLSTVTFMYNGYQETYGTVTSAYDKCWLDRNLGATQVATSSDDLDSYGHLFQWGRLDDGHQVRNSSTSNIQSTSDVPGHPNFILVALDPWDWRTPNNDNLWQGVGGTNNPCPDGFRLPTYEEWDAERASWISNDASGAFNSPLKLPRTGMRDILNGSVMYEGYLGGYWSSTINDLSAWSLIFNSSSANMTSAGRGGGFSVRCIKSGPLPDQPSPINGPENPCENEAGLIYNVTPEPDVSYSWSVPTDWSITDGQGTCEITVTSGTDSGNIEVIPTNLNGYGDAQTLSVETIVCYPLGFVHCNPENPTEVIEVISPSTGKTWMDRNLGASQVAIDSDDADAYGDLYQWGRFAEGHHCRTSLVYDSGLANTVVPNGGNAWDAKFIASESSPNDWISPQDDNLWQSINGVNNPCPGGYRLPTEAEMEEERLSWSNGNNAAGAIASVLKLPMPGRRIFSDGSFLNVGSIGYYWSSTINGIYTRHLNFSADSAGMLSFNRANGLSVRCIKN